MSEPGSNGGHSLEPQDARITELRTLMDERDVRYQQRFDAQQLAVKDGLAAAEKATTVALTSAEKAVSKAETAADKRFDATNEFRGQLNDIINTLLSRAEYQAEHQALVDKVDANAQRLLRLESTSVGRNQILGYVAGLAGVGVALASLLLR